MTPERWDQIDKLLQTALDLPPSQRAVFLSGACAGDELLRSEVDSILASYSNNFMERPALDATVNLATSTAGEGCTKASDLIGRSLGRFTLLELLGEGGMGQVYLARDTKLGRNVAIKMLMPDLTRTGANLLRFKQEALAVSSLNHPYILTVYDVDEIDSLHFIATEFVKGKTLKHHISARKMSLQVIIDITIQVGEALAAAHQVGVVHRDIKPENIMIRPDGYVKVLDFGLAKLTEGTRIEGSTEVPLRPLVNTERRMLMGTPLYMSPEQVRGFDVDGRTDIFSLGVVLYEMVTGTTPFRGATVSDIMAAILEREPPLLRQMPPELREIVTTALKKDREERYKTVEDLVADMQSLREAEVQRANKVTLPMGDQNAVHRTNERAEIDTPNELIAQSNKNPAQITLGAKTLITLMRDFDRRALVILTVIIIFGIVIGLRWFGPLSPVKTDLGVSTSLAGSQLIYRLRITIVDLQGIPVEDAKIWSSIGGEAKKVAGGWQFDIPSASKPASGQLTIYASRDIDFLIGKEDLQLREDLNPAITVQLARDTSASVLGIVVDESGQALNGARVSVKGREESVITGAGGNFVLPAHSAINQQVELYVEKEGFSPITQWHPAGEEPATIKLERRKH